MFPLRSSPQALSAFVVGRGIEVSCNDVRVIFLDDLPELAQQLFCNIAPLCCRVARVCGDGCVRAVPLLRRRTYCSVVVMRLRLLDQTQQPPSLLYPGRQFAPPSRDTPPVKCVSHTSWRQRPTHIVRKPNPTRSPGIISVMRTPGAPADMSHRKT